MIHEKMEQLQKALMHEVSRNRSLQEQYRLQEEKLTKLAQEMPSQSPMESRAQSPSPPPSFDSAKPPAMEMNMTSLPSSLKEARSVTALNEKLQRKEDTIKTKQAQIKMLLAENERLRTGSSRARTELARLRAKLRMCRCNGQHQPEPVMGDSDEISNPSLKYQIQDELHEVSADEPLYLNGSTRQGKSGVRSSGVLYSGVQYEQTDDKQDPVSLFMGSRPSSRASSRRKPPVTLTPVGKPKKEDFHAGIVGVRVNSPTARKQSTPAARNQSA